MDTNLLDIKFARIGARLKVADRPARRSRTSGVISLDVQADRKGEFFEIVRQPGAEAEIAVLDVQPADRHLLLLVREGKDKSKFLCGHDERHWFVAGIPETAPVGTVRQAKEALKPAEVQTAQAGKGLRAKARNRRKNAAYRPPGRVVLPAGPWLRRGREAGPAERAAAPGQRRQAALGRVLLPHGRRDGLRLLPPPERRHRGAVQGHPGRQPEGEGLGLADDAAESRRLRPGPHPARRPRHDHPARLAPGPDEHRGPVEGDAERGLPGLTPTEEATKTARGGDEPLRASVICGRRPNEEKTMDRNLVTISKFLAKHLRHAPDALGLTLQPGGWVSVDDLLAASERAGFTITYDELIECVETNDKKRFSFDDTGDLIRANQGHSVEVDLQLEEKQPPDVLYHGTVERFLASIMEEGLKKGKRHHVHLSKDIETARKVGVEAW